MKFASKKILILAIVFTAIIAFFYYMGLSEYFTLHKLQENHRFLTGFVQKHYICSVVMYIGIFSVLIACALPIIIPLALVGGFLYGVIFGLLYVQISCLIGSVCSFLVLRYVMANWIRDWHNERINKFNVQVQKYGYSYLLMLHFLSIIPLFVINLLAAVANVPLATIMWVTVIGTLPLNFLCVFAGQQLGTIRSMSDIFSTNIMILLAILALVAFAPLFIKKIRGSLGV